MFLFFFTLHASLMFIQNHVAYTALEGTVSAYLAVDVEGFQCQTEGAAFEAVKHRQQLSAHADLLLELGRQVQACCCHALKQGVVTGDRPNTWYQP